MDSVPKITSEQAKAYQVKLKNHLAALELGGDGLQGELSGAFGCLQWLRRYAVQEETLADDVQREVVTAMNELSNHLDTFRISGEPAIGALVEEIRHLWTPRLSI